MDLTVALGYRSSCISKSVGIKRGSDVVSSNKKVNTDTMSSGTDFGLRVPCSFAAEVKTQTGYIRTRHVIQR